MRQREIQAARQALSHARAANEDMRNPRSPSDFFRHWSSFLTEFYNIHNMLFSGNKEGGLDEKAWNKQVEAKRYEDPLFRYLTVARQVKDKTATMTIGVIPPMFAGIVTVPVSGNGPSISVGHQSSWFIQPLRVTSGGKTADPPEQHCGKSLKDDLRCQTWFDVLDIAMASMEQIIAEAETHFVRT